MVTGDSESNAMAGVRCFDLLPVLSESEERVSVAEVLAARDRSLSDRELWSVCREACLAIVGVANSAEVFQMLCVTPETLAFDSCGAVCFVNLSPEPDVLYVPPEYEEVGNSFKGHIFSLGMTMLYAAGYNTLTANHSLDLSPELEDVITAMTMDEYDDRATLETVLDQCHAMLEGASSEDICGQLAAVVKLDASLEEHQVDNSLRENLFASLTPSPCFPASPRGMESPTEPLYSSTPSRDDASETAVTSDDASVTLVTSLAGEAVSQDSFADERTLSIVDPFEKMQLSTDWEILDGDSSCDGDECPTMGDGEGDVGASEAVSEGTTNEDSQDKDGSIHIPGSTLETISNQITDDIEVFNANVDREDDHDAYHEDLPGDYNRHSDVGDGDQDQSSLSPSCDESGNQMDSCINYGGDAGRKYWEEVESREIVISQSSPLLFAVSTMQSDLSQSQSMKVCNETGHPIGSDCISTTNDVAATTTAGASLLSTAGVGHARPHHNRRGWLQRFNEPCNVTLEGSQDSPYKYVKNGQRPGSGSSVRTKTTVPYHAVFWRKCETTERGVDGLPCPRLQYTSIDDRYSNDCDTDLAAAVEMEFDVLTLGDLKLQAGSGGRVIPLCQTLTDISKTPQVQQMPESETQDVEQSEDGETLEQREAGDSEQREDGETMEHQTVREILEKLGSGLHETELWALCTECVLALQTAGAEALPGYVSLDTAAITDDGHVTFQEVAEIAELELIYLAPELQQDGVITEKTCLFGIAVMLWSAADYKMPTNQEPALSEEFENLLISMTQDNADLRPVPSSVLEVCEGYQRSQDVASVLVCQMLAADARKAEAFGKTNVLVRNLLDEALEYESVSQKAELMDSIKTAQLNLKPVSDRQLPERHITKCLHERLMEEIRHPEFKLRKCRQPRLRPVQALFRSDDRLLRCLAKVTSGVTNNSTCESLQTSSGSAFSQYHGVTQRKADDSSVSLALNSLATHFKPIVLTPTVEVKRREMPKVPTLTDAERDKKVARKLEELKMNVRRNQLPSHLASDVERETGGEGKYVSELRVGKVGEETRQNREGRSPRNCCARSGSDRGMQTGEGSPRCVSQSSHVRQGGCYHGSLQGNAISSPVRNGQFCRSVSGDSQGHVTTPEVSPCQQRCCSDDAMSHSVFPGQSPLSSPGQYHDNSPTSPLRQFSQGYPPTGFLPQQMAAPHQPYPMATPFPFQVQLQQDPRTGLFQMIPVPMATMPPVPAMMPSYSMPVIPTPSPPMLEHRCDTSGHSKQTRYQANASTSEGRSRGVRGRIRSSKVHRSRVSETADRERDMNDELELGPKTCSRLEEVDEGRTREQTGSYEDSDEGSDPEMPPDHRRWKPNLTRAKSGSHIDYEQSEVDSDVSPPSAFSRTTYRSSLRLKDGLSHSQPNIGDHQMALYNDGKKKLDCVSPDLCSSPPPSPSWSKDSGVSGVTVKGASDATLMERLLNGDAVKQQQRLARVTRLIRDEFAFDGYMENGIEDLAMAEYILSLGNLKWETFQSAVTEKYCDLYWQDELMTRLYEAVNGHKPVTVFEHRSVARKQRSKPPRTPPAGAGEPDPTSLSRGLGTCRPRPMSDTDDDAAGRPSPVAVPFSESSRRGNNKWEDREQTKELSSHGPRKEVWYLGEPDVNAERSIRSQNGRRDYDRSVSMSNIYSGGKDDGVCSQNAARTMHRSQCALNGVIESSCEDIDDSDEHSTLSVAIPDATVDSTCDLSGSTNAEKLGKFKSQSTYFVYPQNSESSSINSARTKHSDLDTNPSIGNGPKLLSAKSESHLGAQTHTKQTTKLAGPAGSVQRRLDKGSVVYFHAEMAAKASAGNPAYEPDSKTKSGIEAKMTELNHRMSIEHRNRRKSHEYYRKLVEATKVGSKVSSEHRTWLAKVLNDINETTKTLDFLDSNMKHLEMLHAEQWGLEHGLLFALANCPGNEPMLLAPCDNELVHYQSVTTGGMGSEVLHAGMPLGLMAYLFGQHALSDGYIHQFFYCYRYFARPADLLRFLTDKYTAATESLSPDSRVPVKVKARALDLVQVWLEGYYGIDFRNSPELTASLREFLKTEVVPVDASAESLLELMELCDEHRHIDLDYSDFRAVSGSVTAETQTTDDYQQLKKTSVVSESEAGSEWDSFKAALHISAKPTKLQPRSKSMRKASMNSRYDDAYPKQDLSRTESFNLIDYTAQTLAEQLTLLEQELFQLSHPVSYLDSKARGVSVDLADPVMLKAQRMAGNRLNKPWEDVQGSSLFVHTDRSDNVIQQLIGHAQDVACWVAAEIVSCNSIKIQVIMLSRFIETARVCSDLRNFAGCLAILDGLENILVRQLPAWRSLPSKYKCIIDELAAVRIFLKTDGMCLTGGGTEERCLPTMPCILLFLLHVQQLEIGGFTLANGMYKWTKLKKLCTIVDQVRHFKQTPYRFPVDSSLQTSLRQRIAALSQRDIHTLASLHDGNVLKVTGGGGGIQGALRRMRNKFQ